ncbi:hypothetical protein tinsulaeT_00640 [Thalassotalea insulae]|uniref:Uncharacterized protein n=1 Tax=Thalassotalea insulae TaxID=2056778 RepID=A0ABQ6GM83_9GAMM|nr:hypothetical protein [Thalassotalea insulae]GLX76724.1 hypothetical protein tinsulaeT_00640 [Thalassotalea insulae]
MLEVYLSISIIIGLIIIYDGYLIIKNQGVIGIGQFAMITSTIEFLWAIVSIVALFALEFQNWQVLIPALYITHNILGWVYGFWLESKSPTEKIDKVVVPLWYAKFGFNFGVVFTFGCVLVQYHMYS